MTWVSPHDHSPMQRSRAQSARPNAVSQRAAPACRRGIRGKGRAAVASSLTSAFRTSSAPQLPARGGVTSRYSRPGSDPRCFRPRACPSQVAREEFEAECRMLQLEPKVGLSVAPLEDASVAAVPVPNTKCTSPTYE